MINSDSIVHGLRNGFVAGLWAFIPGLLVVIDTDDSFDFSLLLDSVILIIVFPVILCVCCLITSLAFITAKDMFLSTMTCGVSGMFIMNIFIQLLYIISYEINGINVEIEFADFVDLQQLLIGILIGIFSVLVIGVNRNHIIYVYTK
tara:strand:- start:59 stop:499 length:441 start_codon:yes stop_codon:yes gene_type:complete